MIIIAYQRPAPFGLVSQPIIHSYRKDLKLETLPQKTTASNNTLTSQAIETPAPLLHQLRCSSNPHNRLPSPTLFPLLNTTSAVMLLSLRPLTLGLGLTAAFAAHSFHRSRPLLCESLAASSLRTYSDETKVPVFRNGRPNPAAYRQISAGSLLGREALFFLSWRRGGGDGGLLIDEIGGEEEAG